MLKKIQENKVKIEKSNFSDVLFFNNLLVYATLSKDTIYSPSFLSEFSFFPLFFPIRYPMYPQTIPAPIAACNENSKLSTSPLGGSQRDSNQGL